MEKKKLIIGIFAFVVLIAGASLLYGQLSKDFTPDSIAESQGQGQVSEEEEEGQQLQMAPDFTVYDEDGNAVTLHQYFGKPIVLNFWASWCGPCKEEIPNIAKIYKTYAGKDFDVLSVAVWDNPENTKAAAAEHGVVWNQIINAQRIPTDLYGIQGIPQIMLFGPDGTILRRDLRGDAIEAAVKEALGR